ncbi:hypothetical protein [Burkholderia gladioli]|uniref:hypothetical protein n=1 Tax=Burkholderia gladioli TaxID=28095 RepID=UPI00163ED8F0|nr:hypothetical protein [Burkholderia gladioli]
MKMNRTDLIQLLDDTKRALLADDSFEGRINYTCMAPEVELGDDEFEVSAAVRLGNSEGQGSMRMIRSDLDRVLSWPDFLDAPGYGAEHPDYPAAVELFARVNAWLEMDRKQLIQALITLHNEACHVKNQLSAHKLPLPGTCTPT